MRRIQRYVSFTNFLIWYVYFVFVLHQHQHQCWNSRSIGRGKNDICLRLLVLGLKSCYIAMNSLLSSVWLFLFFSFSIRIYEQCASAYTDRSEHQFENSHFRLTINNNCSVAFSISWIPFLKLDLSICHRNPHYWLIILLFIWYLND